MQTSNLKRHRPFGRGATYTKRINEPTVAGVAGVLLLGWLLFLFTAAVYALIVWLAIDVVGGHNLALNEALGGGLLFAALKANLSTGSA